MGKRILVEPDLCTGCMICAQVCSLTKTRTCNPARARVRIVDCERTGVTVPVVCQDCAEPVCLFCCPPAAIRQDPASGLVSIDRESCTNCRICMRVCPFGGPTLGPRRTAGPPLRSLRRATGMRGELPDRSALLCEASVDTAALGSAAWADIRLSSSMGRRMTYRGRSTGLPRKGQRFGGQPGLERPPAVGRLEQRPPGGTGAVRRLGADLRRGSGLRHTAPLRLDGTRYQASRRRQRGHHCRGTPDRDLGSVLLPL